MGESMPANDRIQHPVALVVAVFCIAALPSPCPVGESLLGVSQSGFQKGTPDPTFSPAFTEENRVSTAVIITIQRHFLVSAPSVNAMMKTRTRRGFISRVPGLARSIRLLLPLDELP